MAVITVVYKRTSTDDGREIDEVETVQRATADA